MIIRIKKCNNPKFWYYDQEGKVFDRVTFDKYYNEYYVENIGYVEADDCEMIDFENSSKNITIFDKIRQWGEDRNFYGNGGATIQSQFVKLAEEMGELAGNIARGKDCTDDIGDMIVVLTHIAKLQGKTVEESIEHSYNDIKDRKGQFVNGSFIKESDLK